MDGFACREPQRSRRSRESWGSVSGAGAERPAGLSTRQETLRQEIQATLDERAGEGGGCAYVSPGEYAERFKVSEAEVLRDISHLLETGHLETITVEISK